MPSDFERSEYIKRLHKIQMATRTLINKMKSLPGEDGYIFEGSSNDVEDVNKALMNLEEYLIDTGREDLY
jgi:hypothetical protein